jgi:hypothetical protein
MRITFANEVERMRFAAFCQTEIGRNERIAEAFRNKKAVRPSERAMALAECATRIDRYRQMEAAATLAKPFTGQSLYQSWRDHMNVSGTPTVEWDALSDFDKAGWVALAQTANGDAI